MSTDRRDSTNENNNSKNYILLNSSSNLPVESFGIEIENGPKSIPEEILNINCVLIGDEKVGKSSILDTYFSPCNGFKTSYGPTTREDYTVEKELKDGFGHEHRICLNIVDTGGNKDLDRLRPLCYNEANVFILCFSVVVPSSFQSLITKWLPEIRRHTDQRKISVFLVGTQSDLRSNPIHLLKLSNGGLTPVSESRAIRFGGKIGAKNYIECSALNQKNIRQIFDYVMIRGVHQHFRKSSPARYLEGGCQPQSHNNESETVIHGGTTTISTTLDKENKLYYGKKGRHLRQTLTKQWSLRKSYKMKRLVLFSCFFN